MNQEDQQDALINDLHKLFDRFIDEYDLTHVSVLGALEVVKWEILMDLDLKTDL